MYFNVMNRIYNELGRANAELTLSATFALHRLAVPRSSLHTLSVRQKYPMDPQPIRVGSAHLHTHFDSEIDIFGMKSPDADIMRGRIKEPIEDGSRHVVRGGVPVPYIPRNIRANDNTLIVTAYTMTPDPEEGPVIVNDFGFDKYFQRTTFYNTKSGTVSVLGGIASYEGDRVLAKDTQIIDAGELPVDIESRRLMEVIKTVKLANSILNKVAVTGEEDIIWNVS